MICAECERQFDGNDYICTACRHRKGQGRMTAKYDADGHNQWGTRYHSVCANCNAEYPANMYGMGTCMVCSKYNNPMGKA